MGYLCSWRTYPQPVVCFEWVCYEVLQSETSWLYMEHCIVALSLLETICWDCDAGKLKSNNTPIIERPKGTPLMADQLVAQSL